MLALAVKASTGRPVRQDEYVTPGETHTHAPLPAVVRITAVTPCPSVRRGVHTDRHHSESLLGNGSGYSNGIHGKVVVIVRRYTFAQLAYIAFQFHLFDNFH